MHTALISAASIAALAAGASADFLLIPESNSDVVNIHSAFDGSLVELGAFDVAAAAAANNYTGSLTPVQARQIGDEVWVTDQLADRIWRFDANTRQPLSPIGGNADNQGLFDNVRGWDVVGDIAYLAIGGSNGGLDEGIVRYDIANDLVLGSTSFGFDSADISLFDVTVVGNELLVSNIDSGNDAILRLDTDLNFLGNFATSDGVASFDFVQQLSVAPNGDILAGGFSPPSGVFRFSSDGTPLGVVAGDGFGPRGAFELGNGDILWTNGAGVQTDALGVISAGSSRFITPAAIPAPGAAGLLALAGLASTRRRR